MSAQAGKARRIGIIMNGVTGRMGTNQHLLRSIVPIIREGGVRLSEGERIVPDPILVGRNGAKLEALAKASGVERFTTSLDEALGEPSYTVYFDAQTTLLRGEAVKRAIAAGKHIYCEKPTATSLEEAFELYRLAAGAGVKHGVVQDKLWLPGIRKLKGLVETGYFGRILSVRGEFGYWVFDGSNVPAQRPSWNYRREEGGGIIVDMLCHWRYLLEDLFGRVRSVSCLGATHIPERRDEEGVLYASTAEDAAYATFELEGGIVAHFNSSWSVRVRRDDLLAIQVDGTNGSAVAGLRECWVQPQAATPKAIWNPDIPQPIDFFEHWVQLPNQHEYGNAFKAQWELFLRHVALDDPFPWDLRAGAEGVQLAEAAFESWKRRAWVDLAELDRAGPAPVREGGQEAGKTEAAGRGGAR